MKKITKLFCLLLSLIMIFSLTSCGKKEEDQKTQGNNSSKDFVYSMEELPIKLEGADINEVFTIGDKIYAYGMQYDYGEEMPEARMEEQAVLEGAEDTISEENATEEATLEDTATEADTEEAATEADAADEPADTGEEPASGSVTMVVGSFSMDGTLIDTFTKTFGAESGTNGFALDKDGNVYFVLDEYGKDTTDPENPKDVFTLLSYDSKGNERWNVVLGSDTKSEDYFYVNQLATDKDGNIIISSSKGLSMYGPDSNLISEITLDETDGAGNLVMLKGETCAMITYGEDSIYLKTADFTAKTLSEAQKFPFNSYNYSMFSGSTFDLFLTDSNGLYGFNLGDTEVTKIMDYVDSDIVNDNMYGVKPIDETTLIGTYYDEDSGIVKCAKFTKVDPATIKDKEILTLGCMYLDSDIRKQVVAYNKASDSFRIRVNDYSTYNTESDYTVGYTKLNTDIIAGNMPDILMLTTEMPVKSYIQKGLLADINPFFENDAELKKEDYLPNVMEAVSQDGKMYQVVPGFYVFTVFGKTADVGPESGWTFADLEKVLASKGPDVKSFTDITRKDFMNYSMWFCNEQYINWKTGECSFNSEDFVKNLEFASQFPEEINYDDYDEDYWNEYQKAYRDGKTLLMISSMSTFDDYNMNEQGTFGEAITPIGFPAADKNGNALNFNLDFAISAKSKNQQEAWNFIRYFLTDEYQEKLEYCLPVKLSQLDALAKKAQSKPFYTEEDGSKVEYDNTYYINGEEVVIPPMTQEQTDKVIDFIKSVNHVMDYNTSISDIINEESEAYFTGQKTAQEVADIIQSRIQIYVNENR